MALVGSDHVRGQAQCGIAPEFNYPHTIGSANLLERLYSGIKDNFVVKLEAVCRGSRDIGRTQVYVINPMFFDIVGIYAERTLISRNHIDE